MPIKWHHSRSSHKVTSDWNQCEDHADRRPRLGWSNLYQAPYSPVISPCDYDLIPKMTAPLQGIRFRTVNDVLQATNHSLQPPEIRHCQW